MQPDLTLSYIIPTPDAPGRPGLPLSPSAIIQTIKSCLNNVHAYVHFRQEFQAVPAVQLDSFVLVVHNLAMFYITITK